MTLAGVLVCTAVAAGPTVGAAALRERGIEFGFNLDYDEAIDAFRQSIAADPGNLEGYRLLAAALWSRALYQQGAITTDDYAGKSGSAYRRRASNPELETAARELLRRTEALSAALERARTPSVEDRYQVGASYRFLSTLEGTISGNQWRSLGAARRAYREHERVLAIDATRVDAGLTVGLYRFMVSTLPIWSRVVAKVAGLDSDRKQGLRLVEEAAAANGPMQASALFALIVIYNYEERYDDTLRVIRELQRKFPRNRLLWLEAAHTELRAGRGADARISIAHGLRMLDTDTRPLAPGERRRWHDLSSIASRSR
jgi:tetratricopeptide (TPR) repeat protein